MKKKILLLAFFSTLAAYTFGQSAAFIVARTKAAAYVQANGLKYNSKLNVYLGNNTAASGNSDIIHIFMFEDGNLLLAGYPTTATEKSKFQVHLFVQNTNASSYLLEYTGSYAPVLNVQNSNANPAAIQPAAPGPPPPPVINQLDFAVLGPFTNTLIVTLKQAPNPAGTYTTLTSTTIQIAKTIYASIGSGLVFTSLKSPGNIHTLRKPNGDTTLIADDNKSRILLTLGATFYPWGRNNLMLPGWGFKDRFGIVVATTIGTGTSNFQNLLVGGQYDFSIGGSLMAGLHYGRRQMISGVDYSSFQFGQTKFTGDLAAKEYMQGDIGFFIGLQLDSRIFSQIFK
jgi:hypothetical protein